MSPGTTPEVERLRGVIDAAVTELCNLAEEVQAKHPEVADRIWDVTNERLELPVRLGGARV